MSHVRTQIRDATVTALAGVGEVFATRTIPVESTALPVVLVYTNSEDIARLAVGVYVRTLELVVEIVARGRTVDDDLDAKIVLAETALNGNGLGGLCRPLVPVSIVVDVETAGELPIGRARMTYSAVYQTAHTSPEASV